jgi:hypothetical protein
MLLSKSEFRYPCQALAPKLEPRFTLFFDGAMSEQHDAEEVLLKLRALLGSIQFEILSILDSAEWAYGPVAGERLEIRLFHSSPLTSVNAGEFKASFPNISFCYVEKGAPALAAGLGDSALLFVNGDEDCDDAGVEFKKTIATFSDLIILTCDDEISNFEYLSELCVDQGKPVIILDPEKSPLFLDCAVLPSLAASEIRAAPRKWNRLVALSQPLERNSLVLSLTRMCLADDDCAVTGTFQRHSVLMDYFRLPGLKTNQTSRAGMLDKVLSSLLATRSLKGISRYNCNSSSFGIPDHSNTDAGFAEPEVLHRFFDWSDRRANLAAGRYRDASWALYLLASAAVFFAIFGAIGLGKNPAMWALAEAGVLILIAAIFFKTRKSGWHQLWLFHRYFAEQLRYARASHAFLSIQPAVVANPFSRKDFNSPVNLEYPEQWLIRRIALASGLPRHPKAQSLKIIDLAIQGKASFLEMIDIQIAYHKANQHKLHRMEHNTHRLSSFCFVATAAGVALHFIIHAEWLLILTAGLPAFAAAMHGISTQNEFKRLEILSAATAEELQHMRAVIAGIDAGDPLHWPALKTLVTNACEVMSNMTEDWQRLVKARETALPA